MTRWLALLPLLVALSGCGETVDCDCPCDAAGAAHGGDATASCDVACPAADATPPDGGGHADGRGDAAPRDVGPADTGGGGDLGPDAGAIDAAADARSDAGVGDAGRDAPEPDGGDGGAGADAAPSDASPDAALDARPDVGPDAGPLVASCPATYADPIETGRLDTTELNEASGIAGSRLAPDVLWLHNDSGDGPRLFAVRDDGRLLAILTLEGVRARDFEDLSAGPCPDGAGACLWVGDVGNNNRNRTELTVYVVREPALPPVAGDVVALESPPDWTLPFSYPGDPIDCEGLAVAVDGATFYVFEKADRDDIRVFHHPGPLTDGVAATVEEVAAFTLVGWTGGGGRMVTGADIHPGGRRLLLRTYGGAVEYRFADGQGIAELAVAAGAVVSRGPSSEPQGEAACYDASGLGYWTVSEQSGGNQPLHFYPCD